MAGGSETSEDRPAVQTMRLSASGRVLGYLRDNGFKTYLVSAGGADFMRAFSDEAYGVPREQVIGSNVKLRFDTGGERASLAKLAELNLFNDRDTKPMSIGLHIGRRPL